MNTKTAAPMTPAFMAAVCDAAVQAMQGRGLIAQTIRLQEVRDQLRGAPQAASEGRAGWLRLTMRSGVHSMNDNVIGDFRDAQTAYLMGDLLLALDKNNHPEYTHFTTDPAEDATTSARPPSACSQLVTPIERAAANAVIDAYAAQQDGVKEK